MVSILGDWKDVFWGGSNELLFHAVSTKEGPVLKVALSQKILKKFYIANINIPNHILSRKFKFPA